MKRVERMNLALAWASPVFYGAAALTGRHQHAPVVRLMVGLTFATTGLALAHTWRWHHRRLSRRS